MYFLIFFCVTYLNSSDRKGGAVKIYAQIYLQAPAE